MENPSRLMLQDERNLPGSERLGKLLFLRLDPILRNLLAVIQQHQEIMAAAEGSSSNKDDECMGQLEREERILGLLKAEAELLNQLEAAILNFPSNYLLVRDTKTTSSESLLLQQISASMLILMDYLVLPLIAIFQRPTTTNRIANNAGKQSDVHRRLHIRQSAERKSIAMAGRTLITYLKAIERARMDGALSTGISPSKVVHLMIACCSALPPGREIAEQGTISFEAGGLDRGEDFLEAVLGVVSSLLQVFGSQRSREHDDANGGALGSQHSNTKMTAKMGALGEEIARALDGALVAHLVDSCVSIVAPPASFSMSTSLQALSILNLLLSEVSEVSLWRSLFPGCFGGLFRTLISGLRGMSSTTQSTLKVLDACLGTFVKLLRLTLRHDNATASNKDQRVEKSLADLKSLARSTLPSEIGEEGEPTKQANVPRKVLSESRDSSRNRIPSTPEANIDEKFLSEINSRVPGPLTVLSNLLLITPYESLRQKATELFEVIMLDTRSIWDKDSLDSLSALSLECCLVLSKDSAEAVAHSSKVVVHRYQNSPEFTKDMKSTLVPRTVSMIEELPALAQRQSELELRNKLKLVAAFLELGSVSENNKTGTCKGLQSSLAAEDVALGIRRAISTLLDVDFAPHADSVVKVAPIELFDRQQMHTSHELSSRPIRLRLLTPASEQETITMIRALGRALGPKHAALFVDLCIADLFNDCVARAEAGNSRFGSSQLSWCHGWIGCLSLIREILYGAYADAMDSSTSHSKKSDRKRLKYLKSLAASILPMLVSSPLWDLPTRPGHSSKYEETTNRIDPTDAKSYLALPAHANNPVMPIALRANAYFLCRLLQIVALFLKLLGKEASALVPTILPPALEKVSAGNAPLIAQNANQVLEEAALALGYKNVASLINEKLDAVAGALLASMRLPGGRSALHAEDRSAEMFEITRTIRATLQFMNDPNEEGGDKDRAHLSYVIELVTTLTERFDCSVSKSTYEAEKALALLEVYESTFRFLLLCYRTKASQAASRMESQNPAPWLDLLASFRALNVGNTESDDDKDDLDDIASPKEGFETHRRNKNLKDDEESAQQTGSGAGERLVSQYEVNFVAILLSRCSFFLSNSNLRLQVGSCAAMAQGFQFLALVARLCKDPEDDTGTAIRRQVSDSWHAIFARLRAMVVEIQASRGTSIVVVSQQNVSYSSPSQGIDVSTQRVYLSNLLELIATMAECSGDFMASRFKNDVFPTLSPLIGSYVEDEMTTEIRDDIPSFDHSRHQRKVRTTTRQSSEAYLIASILRCIKGCFQRHACGRSLVDLIPAIGTLILPFLGETGETGVACEETIEQLVLVDCDALWRPLVQLSGKAFPPPLPWKCTSQPGTSAASLALREEKGSGVLESRARRLVDYIESLPEQPLA